MKIKSSDPCLLEIYAKFHLTMKKKKGVDTHTYQGIDDLVSTIIEDYFLVKPEFSKLNDLLNETP
jgi:hypothetical protein